MSIEYTVHNEYIVHNEYTATQYSIQCVHSTQWVHSVQWADIDRLSKQAAADQGPDSQNLVRIS